MTYRQFGTLKYIMTHAIDMNYIRVFNLTTFGSLVQRGWVSKRGDNIWVTQKGLDAYELYNRAQPNYRKEEADLSERVKLMLNGINRKAKAAK